MLKGEADGFAGDRDVEVQGGRSQRKFKACGPNCWRPFPPTSAPEEAPGGSALEALRPFGLSNLFFPLSAASAYFL